MNTRKIKIIITFLLATVVIALLCIGYYVKAGSSILDGTIINSGAPSLVNYQGVLTDPATGNPVPDGNYQLTFAIYDDPTSIDPSHRLWQEVHIVLVENGLFNVILGDTYPITSSLTDGRDLWLGITVLGDDEMLPRQRLVSVPYAVNASDVHGAEIHPLDVWIEGYGQVINQNGEWVGVPISGCGWTQSCSSGISMTASYGYAFDGTYSGSSLYSGVSGKASNSSGSGVGVIGQSFASGGYGVIGLSDYNAGVYGVSENAVGVSGESENAVGVSGNSTNSYGVYGSSTAGEGVYGNSTNNIGVHGISTTWRGVYGESDTGIGVAGTSNDYIGVVGNSYSNIGVAGYSNQGQAGVYGESQSAFSGVYGTSLSGAGVYGVSENSNGVSGQATNASGVYGNSTAGYGVYGDTGASNHNYGVYTPDNLYSLNYHLAGAVMQVVQNGGTEALEPGDVAVFVGIIVPLEENGLPIIQVAKSAEANSTAVAGVVYSRIDSSVLTGGLPPDGSGAAGLDLTPAGPANPGDYLLLVVQGPAQVKVSAISSAIETGDLLSTAGQAGYLAPATEITIEGIQMAVPGTILGIALEPLDKGLEDLIYVYVALH